MGRVYTCKCGARYFVSDYEELQNTKQCSKCREDVTKDILLYKEEEENEN